MPDSPQPPLTQLAAEAALQHEMYRSWIDAGFTEEQAMLLVGVLTAGLRGGAA